MGLLFGALQEARSEPALQWKDEWLQGYYNGLVITNLSAWGLGLKTSGFGLVTGGLGF